MYQNFNDAPQAALSFLIGQATTINTRAYQTAFPDLPFETLAYVDSTMPEYSPGMVTFISSTVGKAAWFTAGAKDVRKADVTRDKSEVKYHMASIGYGYDTEELGQAQLLGMDLPAAKAIGARRAYREFMWNLTLTGDSDKGLLGLSNQSAVASGPVAANGTGTPNTNWFDSGGNLTKTPAQIVADINGGLTGVFTGSLTVEMADTVLLPYTTISNLAATPMSSTNSETILSFILRTNIYTMMTGKPLTIRGYLNLDTAGSGGTRLMVIYKNTEDVVKNHLPMPHRFFPVYQDGPFNFEIPGAFRAGGIEVMRPGAFRYLYGF